eukprot:COSAG06_NODE_1972_length_7938_cov_4.377216_7_plen_44_part_00
MQMVIPRYYEPQDMFIGAKIVVHHQVSCLGHSARSCRSILFDW